MSYREFLTVRLLGVLVLLPALLALGEVLDRGAGWGWWLAGGVAWLAVCGLVYYRRLRAEANSRDGSAPTARPELSPGRGHRPNFVNGRDRRQLRKLCVSEFLAAQTPLLADLQQHDPWFARGTTKTMILVRLGELAALVLPVR